MARLGSSSTGGRVAGAAIAVAFALASPSAAGATRHVAPGGSDASDCRDASAPCATIAHGIASMASGDELVVADGTYAEPISHVPSGTAAAYTTVRAEHDFGVTIDGSGFANDYLSGIDVSTASYVEIRGFRVKMNQETENNAPIAVRDSDHVKIERCGASYGPITGNASSITVGPSASYVLVEECYGFGGSRYQFVVYQSDHVVVRRSVARNDYWNGSLQCAGFTSYDSFATAWQNDIALDSDTANCSGNLYGGFWSENKTDTAPDTSQSLAGDIVLNVQAFYAGDLDWVVSGTRTIDDMIIWGSSGGYYGNQGDGAAATITANRMTIGGITGTYDGPNGGAGRGTGFSIYGDVPNQLTSSLLVGCQSLGVADYTSSDYNAFFGNGANYGGAHAATPGAHDLSIENGNAVDPRANGLRYLPRIERGSPLASTGKGGGQIGADVVFKVGKSGSLWGEPGWNDVTTEPLWPFPNEDVIGADMASYQGPGAPGVRGFTAGKSLDGAPQTLTTYVWEYLGNEIPADVYGFHIAVGSLPDGAVGAPYDAPVTVGGGVAPYRWKLAGALPPGLALDATTGVVSGTPAKPGSFPFEVTVTDAEPTPARASKKLAIQIGDGAGGGSGAGGGDDGGCGCVVGDAPRGAGLASLALLALALLARRVRSSRPSSA